MTKQMMIIVSYNEDDLKDVFLENNDEENLDEFDAASLAVSELGWAEQSGVKVQEVLIEDMDAIPAYGNVHKLAAAEKTIALVWGLIDIQDTCKNNYKVELTDEQALEVLAIIDHRHDASIGVNWEVIDVHLQMYLQDNKLID
ncbi:MAG: hypothetical protein P8J32_04935 [bacterium]|nr:hypothetical protein [bacterium]